MDKVRKTRSDSKMYQLPKEVLSQVDDMLLNENMKYSDIKHWLETEHNFKISLSSISNYAIKIYRAAQRISDDLERTKFFIDYIGNKSDIDAGKATTAILKSGLLHKISTAEEEFNEMPLEKAGRLLVELNRTELAERKLELEYKKKMELAYEQLEKELMVQMKSYPELIARMRELLMDFKQKLESEPK